MTKQADTKYSVNELIKNRWSPRAFSMDAIPKEIINSLFEAAIWAPSSRNEQPWRFIYGIKGEGLNYDKIFETLVHWNQMWAKSAPMLIISVAKRNSDYHNQDNEYALYDLGQAVANLSLQASSVNLYCHQMGGFDKDKARELFNIPSNYAPATIIAVGYLGNPDILSEDLKELEDKARNRFEMERIVFSSDFKP